MAKFNYYPFQEYNDVQVPKMNFSKDENGNLIDLDQKVAPVAAGINRGDNPITQLANNTMSSENINKGAMDTLGKSSTGEAGKLAALGENAMGASGEILNTGLKTWGQFKTRSRSADERTAQTVGAAVDGFQLGNKLGGPYVGAAVGATMAGVSMIDGAKDKRENAREEDEDLRDKYDDTKKDRAMFYNQNQAMKSKKRALGFTKSFNPNNDL